MIRRDIFALAKESAHNSKSSKKLSWCLAFFLACSVMVIVFCGSFLYITNGAFDNAVQGRILLLSQSAEGQPGAHFTEDELNNIKSSQDVEDYIKYNDYRVYAETRIGDTLIETLHSVNIKSVDTDDGNVLFKYLRDIGAVIGSEVLGEGEVLITRAYADASGYGDNALGKKINVSIDKNYSGTSFTHDKEILLDDDTDPNNLPINAFESGESYVKYPSGNYNINVIKDYTVVGILESNTERKHSYGGLSEEEAGQYALHAPIFSYESDIWINSKSVYNGEEMTPNARNQYMYDASNNVIEATVLTYNFTDYTLKSTVVTDSGKVFMMPSGMLSNGATLIEGVGLAPINNYQIQFKSFNKAMKRFDDNLSILKNRFIESSTLEGNVLSQEWTKFTESITTYQFQTMQKGEQILDFAFKFIAIFGSLLMISLVISIFNATSIYAKSKELSYLNLHKVGANNKTLTTYRRADALMACLKSILIGGTIFAVVAAALYAGMFGALKLIMPLGVKEILIMFGLSAITFTVISVAMTAIMITVIPKQNHANKRITPQYTTKPFNNLS